MTHNADLRISYYVLSPLLTLIFLISFSAYSSPSYGQAETNSNESDISASNATEWKTYTNDNIGVSFDYPSGWEVSEKENRFDTTAADVMVLGEDSKFAIKVIDRTEDRPLKSYALPSSTKLLEDTLAKGEASTIIEHTDTKKYKVGGEKAGTFLMKVDNGVLASGMQNFVVFHNGDGYMLSFLAPAETFDSPESQNMMNKMIQSFKFLK